MAFNYTILFDFIQDQLWSYQDANRLLHTVRHFAEDLLGDPSSNSDQLGDVYMGNGGTHGGRIYFGGTTYYVGYNSSNEFEVSGVNLNVLSPYLISDEKVLVTWQESITALGSSWVTTDNATYELGYTMPRDGNLISTCVVAEAFGAGIVGPLTQTLYKNGGSWLQIGYWASPSGHEVNSTIQGDISTYTFSAGDYIELNHTLGGMGGIRFAINAYMECWIAS